MSSKYTFKLKITGKTFKTYIVTNSYGKVIGEIVANKGYIGPKAYEPEYIAQIEEALIEFKPK